MWSLCQVGICDCDAGWQGTSCSISDEAALQGLEEQWRPRVAADGRFETLEVLGTENQLGLDQISQARPTGWATFDS